MNIIGLRINIKTLTVSLCHEIIGNLKKYIIVDVNYAFIKYTSVLFKINQFETKRKIQFFYTFANFLSNLKGHRVEIDEV